MNKIGMAAALTVSMISVSGCSRMDFSGSMHGDQGNVIHASDKGENPHRLDKIRISGPDFLDAATTTYGIVEMGATEINPILSWAGDAAGIAALPLKYGLKHLLVHFGQTPAQANIAINSGSMIGGCANIMTLGGAAPNIAIPVGLLCSIGYRHFAKKEYERTTGRKINGDPVMP